MMKYIFLTISALLFHSVKMMAQTSNEGMLYIAEGTIFSNVERFNNGATGSVYNDGEAFIYSDFNNDGVLDFLQNKGSTRFVGKSNQIISGSHISYLNNVYFNNLGSAVPFLVTGSLNISGESDFYNGIVDNDNFGGEITFNTNAYHSNTSDKSHVDGPVNKLGEGEFTFPIGDGGYYRPAGISDPNNADAFFEGKYVFHNSDVLYPHALKAGVILEIDNQEYWRLEKNRSTDNGLITLSWRNVTTPATMIEAAQQNALTIVRWDATTTMWVDEGGAIDMDSQTVTTAVNGYGIFTFARVKTDLILPCNLVVYNSITPNGDGKNDYFLIDQSNNNQCAKNLKVMVFNRWGVKVYETTDYGVNGNVFDGFSSGRMTLKNSEKLPFGTYYYILEYQYGKEADQNFHKQAGFLYLSAE